MDVLLLEDLVVMNDGSPTFSRPGARANVLDLTITSRNMRLVWSTEPDSWGSDHIPIHLKALYSIPKRRRTHQVTL